MLKKIEILIVDESEDWVKAIFKCLSREQDLKIVGMAANKEDTLNFIRQNDVDVILLDTNLSCAIIMVA